MEYFVLFHAYILNSDLFWNSVQSSRYLFDDSISIILLKLPLPLNIIY